MALLPDRKHAPRNLGAVLVLGLGKSGRVVAEYLEPLLGTRVEKLAIAGGTRNPEAEEFVDDLRKRAAERGCGIAVSFDTELIEGRYDVCIVSPGISEFGAFYLNAAAASSQIISEVEFAWRESARDSRWVAITGTNGKTTTTALAAHVLCSCGMNARAVGNIGDVALSAVASPCPPDVYVVEVSSFQLASTQLFAPDAAVLLNITPDHLSWHRTHENYVAAKMKVFANLSSVPGAVAIMDATDETVRAKIRAFNAMDAQERGFSVLPLGTAAGIRESMRVRCGADAAAWLDDRTLCVEYAGGRHELCRADELQIAGDHNVLNALAAAAAAVVLGAADAGIAHGLRSFAALPHRIEPCGNVQGVECYNDSKATNTDAVMKALGSFTAKRVVLLAGGRDKGTDLSELVQVANAQAKAVVCFGEARERFHEAFAQGAPQVLLLDAAGMEEALEAAFTCAEEGDVVLLSPACASFDEFSCYQERGDVFKHLVAEHAQASSEAADRRFASPGSAGREPAAPAAARTD